MSKPRYIWWDYAKKMIEVYPERKKELEELRRQSMTIATNGITGGGGPSRGTENIATKQLPRNKQKELDAVELAIKRTRRMPNGKIRIQIIEMVYWKKNKMKLEGAGYKVGYGYTAAREIHSDFVRLVGECYGFDID